VTANFWSLSPKVTLERDYERSAMAPTMPHDHDDDVLTRLKLRFQPTRAAVWEPRRPPSSRPSGDSLRRFRSYTLRCVVSTSALPRSRLYLKADVEEYRRKRAKAAKS
jgi:hypothetical protein